MTTHEMLDPDAREETYRRRLRWGLGAFLAIAFFFLWEEHRAHLFAALPWLLLLACPLMHFFMHRGHRSHHHHDRPTSGEKAGGDEDAWTERGSAARSPSREGSGTLSGSPSTKTHQHGGHGCC